MEGLLRGASSFVQDSNEDICLSSKSDGSSYLESTPRHAPNTSLKAIVPAVHVKPSRGRPLGYKPRRVNGKLRKPKRDPNNPTQREQRELERAAGKISRKYERFLPTPGVQYMTLRKTNISNSLGQNPVKECEQNSEEEDEEHYDGKSQTDGRNVDEDYIVRDGGTGNSSRSFRFSSKPEGSISRFGSCKSRWGSSQYGTQFNHKNILEENDGTREDVIEETRDEYPANWMNKEQRRNHHNNIEREASPYLDNKTMESNQFKDFDDNNEKMDPQINVIDEHEEKREENNTRNIKTKGCLKSYEDQEEVRIEKTSEDVISTNCRSRSNSWSRLKSRSSSSSSSSSSSNNSMPQLAEGICQFNRQKCESGPPKLELQIGTKRITSKRHVGKAKRRKISTEVQESLNNENTRTVLSSTKSPDSEDEDNEVTRDENGSINPKLQPETRNIDSDYEVDGELEIEFEYSEEHDEWERFLKKAMPRKKKLHPSTSNPDVMIEKFSHGQQWLNFVKIYQEGITPPYYGLNENGKIPERLFHKIMTFQPNEVMMEDPERFVSFMAYCGAAYAGGALLVPPNSYHPRKCGYKNVAHQFTPFYQDPDKKRVPNVKTFNFVPPYKKSSKSKTDLSMERYYPDKVYTIESFWKYCQRTGNHTPIGSLKQLEKKFWDNCIKTKKIYLKDSLGSLFDPDFNCFNVDRLNTFFTKHGNWDEVNENDGEGLRRSYIYCSAYGSCFCDHVEDFASYSMNYMHMGESKPWRFVPPLYGLRYVELMKKIQNDNYKEITCDYFPFHKGFMIHDCLLEEYNIPKPKVVQTPGTFIFTFPFAFHSGYANGVTVAEASNFATDGPNWAKLIVCNFQCPKAKETNDCPYGTATTKDPSSWIKAGLGEEIFEQWKRNKLPMHHPYSFQFGEPPIRGKTLPNAMPAYPFDFTRETKETGFLLRNILPTKPTSKYFAREKLFDIHHEINRLRNL